MIGLLFGFCPWHFKLTELITTGYGRCLVSNCFARDSLKTSGKYQAVRVGNQAAPDGGDVLESGESA